MFLYWYADPPHPHSFPTRRSSDLQDLVDHDYQGGNDGHLNDDPDAARNLRTNQGNRQVGESSNGDNRQTHDDGHVHAGGYREGGTDPEDLQADRVEIGRASCRERV